VTNYEHEQHGLYHHELRANGFSYHFQTYQAGLAQTGQKYVGWGTAFVDVDLDGWEDIFVANGHAIRYPQGKDVGRKQPPVLYRNLGSRFHDVSGQIGSYHDSNHLGRGVAFGDLDNDGRTDLVISHINDPVAVLHGIGGKDSHWLGVQLIGRNYADIVGAKVQLCIGDRTWTRFAKGGGSYLSSSDRRIVFGLGPSNGLGRLTVNWPDSGKQDFDGLALDRYHCIHQGKARAESYPEIKR
jgi:hypothetical protein